ncbi:divergent polysaccharide deacetylase family protein, partial [bacterium]
MTAVLGITAVTAAVLVFLFVSYRPLKLPVPEPPPEEVPIPVPLPRIKAFAVIIDDVGHSRSAAASFLENDLPIALSFLPGRPHTRELAEEAYDKGKTILLHLPMEPEGYPGIDPGFGAVLVTQKPGEIDRILRENLEEVPHAVGLNNHMGSKATSDERIMSYILEFVKERDLIFVDSRTTPETVGYRIAMDIGIPALERDVFLDNRRDQISIEEKAAELLDLAESRGWAIGIGHPYPETARALEWMAEEAR